VDDLVNGFKNSEVSNVICAYLKCSAHKHTSGLEKCSQTMWSLFWETWPHAACWFPRDLLFRKSDSVQRPREKELSYYA